MRSLWIVALLSVGAPAAAPPEPTPAALAEDFARFCSEVKSTYAYFDDGARRWDAVAELYAPDLRRIRTRREFVELLEQAIAELHDDHAHLNVNIETSPWLVPSGADLWPEWVGAAATVVEVRPGSDAERAGLRPGAVVAAVDGIPVAQATERIFGRTVDRSDPEVRNWALRRLLAGRRGQPRRIEAEQQGSRRLFELPAKAAIGSDQPPVTFRRLDGEVGYLRFNDSLGDGATVDAFDGALAALRDTKGLIVDLRETPSGGNSTVARGILGRFLAREAGYQKHDLPAEERASGIRRSWIELVSPRGPFRYAGRVTVLVGRWTGSMGEGLAIGFDAVAGATTVGGPMAQLRGATHRIELPHTGIGVSVPAERLYHVNGTPREAFRPRIAVSASAGAERDAVLEAGLREVLASGAERAGGSTPE